MANNTLVDFFKQYGKCIYILKTCKDAEFARFAPVICKDGTFLSVQAGKNYKCYPRENLDDFEYETVEVARNEDTNSETLLSPFVCDYDEYVFDNVHVEVINEIIKRHGGIDHEAVQKFIDSRSNGD